MLPTRHYRIVRENKPVPWRVTDVSKIVRQLAERFPHALFQDGRHEELDSAHPRLRTFRLYHDSVWQQLAAVVFPYNDRVWREAIGRLFRIEGWCWRGWCRRGTPQPTPGLVPVSPLWHGLERAQNGADDPLFGPHEVDGVTILVRPYLPWPTLAERPVLSARRTAIRGAAETAATLLLTGTTHVEPSHIAPDHVPDEFILTDGEQAVPVWWSAYDSSLDRVLRDVLLGTTDAEGNQ